MLREPKGARSYNDRITLLRSEAVVDEYGHASVSSPQKVMDCFACVRQMSATKTMMIFQQADVVGVELKFRYVDIPFNLIEWRGHIIHFSLPENVGNRNVALRVTGYYQIDNPNTDDRVQD